MFFYPFAYRFIVKFDKEKSDVIIPILEEMADETSAGRVALMIRLLLVIAGNDKEHIVGKYRKVDKEKNCLNQIQIYVICNAKREITLDDIAQHVGMNRASFCVFFKKGLSFGINGCRHNIGHQRAQLCHTMLVFGMHRIGE